MVYLNVKMRDVAMRKNVGFNFFRPIAEINGENIYYNFKDIFEQIRTEYATARERIKQGIGPEEYKIIYKYNHEPARLSEVSIDYDTEYYHLVFERLDYQVPNRTTLHGDSEALDLDDDEYIGIDVNLLYDSNNNIFMLQRNRSSLGPNGIELFLKKIISIYTFDENLEFNLAIVPDLTARKRAFNQSSYRKIQLKVAGAAANGIIEKLYGRKNVDVETIEVTFNSATTKKSKINSDYAIGILEEYVENADTQKLLIRAREDDEGLVEPIDLIDQKLQTFITFEFGKQRSLNPESVFKHMIEKFDSDVSEGGGYKNKILRM